MSEILMYVGGDPVYWDEDESKIWYTGELTIDADGCPRAYGPEGCYPEPLDYLGNAGYPGNWWGIATDSFGNPFIQEEDYPKKWPYPGLYISTTAYLWKQYNSNDCRHYVDSENILFTVIPGNVRTAVPPKFLGCNCRVTDNQTQKVAEGIPCCDVGPSSHLGEGSIALASFFGLNPSPKNGGSSDSSRFLWEFWPGISSKTHPLQ
jgi:hypothetical protein